MEGTTVGPYRVIERLGAGGMVEVYRAHDPRLQRDVALRLLSVAHVSSAEMRGGLLRDARAAAALQHPHICAVLDVGEAEGHAFIAMELLDGQPLDRIIPPGGLDDLDVFDYGLQIVDAVTHAHERGVLHRELSAANVMVTGAAHVKLLAFGLRARATRTAAVDPSGSASIPAPDQIADAIAYLSPEQLRGEPATAASDVWALGIILHEMSAGERPFGGRASPEVAAAILEQRPRTLPQTVPAVLRGIVSRCLAKQPAHRYPHAGELRTALEAVHAARLRASRR